MRTLFIECNMGASGDMLMGALYESAFHTCNGDNHSGFGDAFCVGKKTVDSGDALFIECNMGASGDMLMGALYELLSDSQKESFLKTMNNLFPNQILLQAVPAEKCGVWGTKINVVILGQEETPSVKRQQPTTSIRASSVPTS